jgi:hypothetical protein
MRPDGVEVLGLRGSTLADEHFGHRQTVELSSIGAGVMHEVDGPDRGDPGWRSWLASCVGNKTARTSSRYQPRPQPVRSGRMTDHPVPQIASNDQRGCGCPQPLLILRLLRTDPDGIVYRLENWKLLRALALPNFLRSTMRLSRVMKPCFLSTGLRSGS